MKKCVVVLSIVIGGYILLLYYKAIFGGSDPIDSRTFYLGLANNFTMTFLLFFLYSFVTKLWPDTGETEKGVQHRGLNWFLNIEIILFVIALLGSIYVILNCTFFLK